MLNESSVFLTVQGSEVQRTLDGAEDEPPRLIGLRIQWDRHKFGFAISH